MSSDEPYQNLTIQKLKIAAKEEKIPLPPNLKKKKDIIDFMVSYKIDYVNFLSPKGANDDIADPEVPKLENRSEYEKILEDEKNNPFLSKNKINKMGEQEIYNYANEMNITVPSSMETLKDLRFWISGILGEMANGHLWSDSQKKFSYPYDRFEPVRFRNKIKLDDLVEAVQLRGLINKNNVTEGDIKDFSDGNVEYEWLNELRYTKDDVHINRRQHLLIFGWSVVEKAVDKTAIKKTLKEFWDWMEGFEFGKNKIIDRENPESWSHAIEKGHVKGNIYHQNFVWDVRKDLKKYFEEIFMTDELASSFEGMDFSPPPREEDKGVVKIRLKHDQFRMDNRFINVRGLLLLKNCDANDGGICYLRPKNKNVKEFFSEYMSDHPSYGIRPDSFVNQKDPVLIKSNFKKICANEGDLIIYDTRLMYGIVDTQENLRLGIWVSQQPKINMENKIKKERKRAFVNDFGTNLWTFGPWYEEIKPAKIKNARDKKPSCDQVKILI
jgi:hypothetical protein